jgi:ABC-2 type transport system ATP-binding protein
MADRVGVINKGEMILVEKKAELMRKLGKKRLVLQVVERLDAVPSALSAFNLAIGGDGHELIYDYDTRAERTGVATLLGELSKAGVRIRDLQTNQSSLEEIFVGLVNDPRSAS